MIARKQQWSATPDWWPRVGPLAREWLTLEILGHGGLILLRQRCGTKWSWQLGGPFAYWDVSRAMLHGDACWVIAVICTSALRQGLLAEWGRALGTRKRFSARAWVPWLLPGCLLGWAVLIRDDSGAAYILTLPAGWLFEGYHILFFGYVFARLAASLLQLAVLGGLILSRSSRALVSGGPWPYFPLGIAAIAAIAVICAATYWHIYAQGGSIHAHWELFARAQG